MPTGESIQGYDLIVLFKGLILQSLYNLSNDQLEYQILDRLSFSRFLGIDLGKKVPDAKTHTKKERATETQAMTRVSATPSNSLQVLAKTRTYND